MQLICVSLGRRREDHIFIFRCQLGYGALFLATLAGSPAHAQTPRPPILDTISDARLAARLRTAADTLALFRLVVPVALDSLHMTGDSTWPPQLLVAGLDSTLAHPWLMSLLAHGHVQGLCGPVRIHCRGFDAVGATLEDEPGQGDNEVRLVLKLVSVRQRPRTVRYEDDARRWRAMFAAGIPMVGICGGLTCWPPTDFMLPVPWFELTMVAAPDGWHVIRWRRHPNEQ